MWNQRGGSLRWRQKLRRQCGGGTTCRCLLRRSGLARSGRGSRAQAQPRAGRAASCMRQSSGRLCQTWSPRRSRLRRSGAWQRRQRQQLGAGALHACTPQHQCNTAPRRRSTHPPRRSTVPPRKPFCCTWCGRPLAYLNSSSSTCAVHRADPVANLSVASCSAACRPQYSPTSPQYSPSPGGGRDSEPPLPKQVDRSAAMRTAMPILQRAGISGARYSVG